MNDRISEPGAGRHWIPPAGLDRSRPRLLKLTGTGKSVVVLSVVLGLAAIAVGTALGALAAREIEESRLLKQEGLVTDALVTRLWRSRDRDDPPRVAYQFSAGGRVYAQSARLPLRVWRNLRVGSYLRVRYIRMRPEINHPEGYGRPPLPPWVPFLVTAGLAAGSLLALLPLRNQSRLLASGRASPGVIIAHGKRVRSSHGSDLGEYYSYQFRLLSGSISKGKAGPSKKPPAVGSTIVVLYDPENPRKNAPYPLSLVHLTETSTR